jgi:hypothetical protein
MIDELPNGSRSPQPVRAKENSPPIYRRDAGRVGHESRQGRKKKFGVSHAFFRPSGAWGIWGRVDPAMNRWAIFGFPSGTNPTGGVER